MSWWKRYKTLILYIGIGVVCLVLFWKYGYNQQTSPWDFVGALDSATAVALAFLAFMSYLEYIKSEDKIRIFFQIDGEEIDTGLSVMRKHLTRSELFGLLRMIHKTQGNYKIHAINADPNFLNEIYKVSLGSSKKLVIPLFPHELEQFRIKGLKEEKDEYYKKIVRR